MDYLPIVPVTDMIYLLLMLMFVNHVVFMIGNLILEGKLYGRAIKRKLGMEVEKMRVGGFVMGKLRMYQDDI